MFKRSEKKIKAVFKMQFQATQVPQLKAKSLMISLVPVDVGKPTVRLPKAPIVEGTCTWGNPVYETVKLIKEIKTGRIREKFYYVVVSTGSSKSGFLGEVSIDFADLAEAAKPLNLTLPLQTSKSGAILHVTVQNMQRDSDSRYEEDSESPLAEPNDQDMDKESDELSEEASIYNRHNGSLEDTEYEAESRDRFGRLTTEMKALERKTELSELEVQSLRRQIFKETKRGQQLSEQIVCLKEERTALQAENEQLKTSLTCKNQERASTTETQNSSVSLENIKQELLREKQLSKKLKLHLQKTEDSNSEFVLAMRDLNKKLEQKNTEISRLSGRIKAFQNGSESIAASPRVKMDQNEGYDPETLKQKIENLNSEIEAFKEEKAEMQMRVERLSLDCDNLEAENREISTRLEQTETVKMELQHNYTESMDIEKKLRQENKRQGLQYSESLNIIDELELQVESLQKELEAQAQVFEQDLEAITMLKVEQEHRAIRAEEALRKARRSSANAAEEFKQISEEMSMKMDEKENLAEKAIGEADHLHKENEALEVLLQKTKEELKKVREDYEIQCRQQGATGTNQNSANDESAQLWKLEKEDLERRLDLARKEAEKLKTENVSIKSQVDQKRTKEENLHLQVKNLRLKNNEARNHLVELQQEKEGLQKEMSKLQDDLRKKEQELVKAVVRNSSAVNEKNPKCNNCKGLGSNLEKNHMRTEKFEEETTVAEGLSVRKSDQSSALLSEVALLKEKIKGMEEELKEMHERYSEISLRFAEVEGERQQLVMALRNMKNGKKS